MFCKHGGQGWKPWYLRYTIANIHSFFFLYRYLLIYSNDTAVQILRYKKLFCQTYEEINT